MNTSNSLLVKVVGGIVGLLSILGGFAFFRSSPQPSIQTGSVVGPDSYYPVETHNGVGFSFDRRGFAPSTTTICSFKATATSSINFLTLQVGVGTSTALTYRISTSTGPTATTTSVFAFAASANGTPTFIYQGKTGDVVSPGTFVNVSVEGISAVNLGSGLTGSCQLNGIVNY